MNVDSSLWAQTDLTSTMNVDSSSLLSRNILLIYIVYHLEFNTNVDSCTMSKNFTLSDWSISRILRAHKRTPPSFLIMEPMNEDTSGLYEDIIDESPDLGILDLDINQEEDLLSTEIFRPTTQSHIAADQSGAPTQTHIAPADD